MRDKFNKYSSYLRTRSKPTTGERSGTPTLRLARAYGAGAILVGNYGKERYMVSDWSMGTGHVYGWPLDDNNTGLAYELLPAEGLRFECMQQDAKPLGAS